MGCFLGCFGGAKDRRRRKQRVNRASPQRQRNKVQNVQQEIVITAEQTVAETTPTNLVSELRNKPEGVEQLSPSPKKRVTFNSNVTTYEHVPVHESIDSLPECMASVEKEEEKGLKASSQSHSSQSISEDDNSVTSSVGSYPPNHRYHNARDSDDEAAEYGDSDLDDLDDDEDDYDDYDDDDVDVKIAGQEVWSESVLTASMESRTGNPSPHAIDEEAESPMVKPQLPDEDVKAFGTKPNARDRSDYINSVLNPVENITQWKAAKSKGTHVLKPQKENLTGNFEAPRISFSSEPPLGQAPFSFKTKSDQLKNSNQEISVDASLSNWLVSPEITPPKKTSFSGLETITSVRTMSEGCPSVRSFEDRPILGALTVEELRQISPSPSPRKSPSRSPDDMPIIGTVGTYWNHSGSAKRSDSASSFKGIPNTTSKYREDKRVNWHSTPFETRLDRALNRGASEA
ncbi:UNVERIFIED_CONTAM: protein JASON [Sesamum calycinum]|uniref:Protein JASON n=1 Tax=Sesamum calycinum TaxID=2727403 RepID=A0AAW2RU80_9LAMI